MEQIVSAQAGWEMEEMVDRGEMVGAADGGALVDSDRVGGGHAVGEEAGDGRAVEAVDMVAFEDASMSSFQFAATSWTRRR